MSDKQNSVCRDIAERTGGDIYIGVVGPVRTGKSTFIKRFMEELVLPNITGGYSRERARDELPQSAAGKTVMTTEPKFIPDEAVPVTLVDSGTLRVRMIVSMRSAPSKTTARAWYTRRGRRTRCPSSRRRRRERARSYATTRPSAWS